ncbi:UPF0178 protein, partial [Frankliniella fusca]
MSILSRNSLMSAGTCFSTASLIVLLMDPTTMLATPEATHPKTPSLIPTSIFLNMVGRRIRDRGKKGGGKSPSVKRLQLSVARSSFLPQILDFHVYDGGLERVHEHVEHEVDLRSRHRHVQLSLLLDNAGLGGEGVVGLEVHHAASRETGTLLDIGEFDNGHVIVHDVVGDAPQNLIGEFCAIAAAKRNIEVFQTLCMTHQMLQRTWNTLR